MAHYRFLLISCLFLPMQSFALSQEQQYNDNLNWAKQSQQGIIEKAQGKLDINDYCADADCVNQALNPPQAGLDDAAINNKKTSEFFSNDTAGAIQDNFDKGRPDLKNDPDYQFALLGQENAYEISHGISNEYVDCQIGQLCLDKAVKRSCSAPTSNLVPCYLEPVAEIEVGVTRYQCPNGWTLKGTTCHVEVQECRYDRKNKVQDNNQHSSCSGSFTTTYLWDGKKLTDLSRYSKGSLIWSGGGSYCTSWTTREYEICGPVPVEEPAGMTCDEGYTLSGAQCIKNTFTWKSECALSSECSQVKNECIDSADTRIVNGIPTYLDCWKYEQQYQCDVDNTCDELAECTEDSRSCSLQFNGVCIEEEISKTCNIKECSPTSLQCGNDSFCLDGDCYNPMPKHNTEFDKSAAALAGLNAAAKDLGDPPTMFRGKPMKCTDGAFGFADCCKNGGWGTDLGLAQCDEEEKALGQAKEKKLTIDLGSYCAERVLGKCIRRKKTYCVYDSKMARIIQEQGNKNQLNSNFGSAKDPVCNPITPEQLQSINFEHIDFSDFYEDMHTNMELPDMEEIKNRLQSAFED